SSILALILGILAAAVGLSPDKAMERSNSFGIAMAGVIAIVMAPLVTASVQDVINAFLPTVMILIVGGAGIIGGGFIATKLLRWKSGLGMSVALTAMYGFPADYLYEGWTLVTPSRSRDAGGQPPAPLCRRW